MLLSDIRIRDPFILCHEGTYYLYGTIGEPKARELYVHKSLDLVNWEGPEVIYTLRDDSWAKGELWAPEVHLYCGRFYLMHTMLGKNGLRATEISVADSPCGPFLPISDRPATPADRSCIDGTLCTENGRPYLIYSHDWPDCYDESAGAYVGKIEAIELTPDLTRAVGEPFLLFSSKEAPLSGEHPTHCSWRGQKIVRYGSDGPFVHRLRDGRHFLVWSPIPDGNYMILGAVADSVRGPWQHLDTPVFANNGGHSMIFADKDGDLRLCLHWPEIYWQERPMLLPIREEHGRLVAE